MEIINYPLLTSSPVSSADTPVPTSNVDGLPSPNLTEPSYSSPKTKVLMVQVQVCLIQLIHQRPWAPNPTVSTLPSSAAASGKPVDSTPPLSDAPLLDRRHQPQLELFRRQIRFPHPKSSTLPNTPTRN